jgi:hypothetical protein
MLRSPPVGVVAHEGWVAVERHGGLPLQVQAGQLPRHRAQPCQQQVHIALRGRPVLLQQRDGIQPCVTPRTWIREGWNAIVDKLLQCPSPLSWNKHVLAMQ